VLKNELTDADRASYWESLYNKTLNHFEELRTEYNKIVLFNDLLIKDNEEKAKEINSKQNTIKILDKEIQSFQLFISKNILLKEVK